MRKKQQNAKSKKQQNAKEVTKCEISNKKQERKSNIRGKREVIKKRKMQEVIKKKK